MIRFSIWDEHKKPKPKLLVMSIGIFSSHIMHRFGYRIALLLVERIAGIIARSSSRESRVALWLSFETQIRLAGPAWILELRLTRTIRAK